MSVSMETEKQMQKQSSRQIYDMAIQNIQKFFTFRQFSSYEDFRDYDRSIEDPSHYEIIHGNQCLYFDFDGQVDLNRLTDCIVAKFKDFSILINVYTSSDNEENAREDRKGLLKHSFHVVVKGAYFDNHLTCGAMAKEIARCLDQASASVFDATVYSEKRNLRMLRSRKVDSIRVKRFLTTTYRSADYKCRFENDPLYMSLVIGTHDCTHIGLSIPRESLSTNDKLCCLTEEQRDMMMALVADAMPDVYEKRDERGATIFLKRRKAAMCVVCDRKHDNDGACLAYTKRGVFFTCFRDTTQRVCLSRFGQDEEELDAEIIIPLRPLPECTEPVKPQQHPIDLQGHSENETRSRASVDEFVRVMINRFSLRKQTLTVL